MSIAIQFAFSRSTWAASTLSFWQVEKNNPPFFFGWGRPSPIDQPGRCRSRYLKIAEPLCQKGGFM